MFSSSPVTPFIRTEPSDEKLQLISGFPFGQSACQKASLFPPAVETRFLAGDCLTVLRNCFPDDTFDLIITSPPYADSREKTYGGISPERYVEWFLPRAAEFRRVLKPTGTFVLNIKEKVVKGERHTYVLELILALRRQGWLWTEEYIWHKKNCYPGKWPNRFRDAWERCLQFNRQRNFRMFQEAVCVPVGTWATKRLGAPGPNDHCRLISRTGSGFGRNVSHWKERSQVYPTNVLHLSTETSNREHSAPFPRALPEWFIRLFTREGDWVLDPFAGSGTTGVVARQLGRHSVNIDICPEYVTAAQRRMEQESLQPAGDTACLPRLSRQSRKPFCPPISTTNGTCSFQQMSLWDSES